MAVDVSEQEQDWAKSAKDAFDSHRFENCLSTLNKLLESRRRDARVAHNRAVAQYMLSNLTHTDDFRKTLQSVSSQVSSIVQLVRRAIGLLLFKHGGRQCHLFSVPLENYKMYRKVGRATTNTCNF